MSGASALFEVLGHLRLTAGRKGCPKSLQGCVVKLKNAPGEVFEVPAEAACVSSKIRQTIIRDGVEKEIQFQVSKDVMNKVIDYMKHHTDSPGSEIRTPLTGDNIGECGATKFDANYVKLERDKLFELMMAATFFDIQGLFLLVSAQLSLMLRDKPADKLRKDLNMTNDLPSAEEEELAEALNQIRAKKHKAPFDEESTELAMNAAFIAGMTLAAQKHGVSEATKKDFGLLTLSAKSWRLAMWTSAVAMEWKVLQRAPEEVCGDRALMSMAVALSRGEALRYAKGDLPGDKPLILEAVQLNGANLDHAGDALRADREFVTEAAMISGRAMYGAVDALRSDSAFVLGVTNAGLGGSALNGASAELTGDANFVLAAVVKDPEAFKHASEELATSKQFAIQAAARNGLTLQYMSPEFRADKDVVITAVMENKTAALFAHVSRRADIGMLAPENAFGALSAEDKYDSIGEKGPMTGGTKKMCCSTDVGVEFNRANYLKTERLVQFSASNTMMANMGQSNYIASNSFLDKIPFYERPEFQSVTLMWGAVGNIGMRWKAFASADFLNQTPENLISVMDASKFLKVTMMHGVPEWYNVFYYDSQSREAVLAPSAGFGSGGGYKPSEDAAVPAGPAAAEKPRFAVWKRPEPAEAEAGAAATQEEEAQEEAQEEVPSCPLGGWPGLLRGAEALAPRLAMPFQEGARVRLCGLSSNNGMEGVLLRQTADGKWKVLFENGSGTALLSSSNLEVISYSEEGEFIPAGLSKQESRVLEKQLMAEKVEAEKEAVAAARKTAEEEKAAELQRILNDSVPQWY